MRESLIDISGKIDKKRLGAIEAIAKLANSREIPFFIIGASARDFLLYYGHNIATTRATLDIDFGVRVPDWNQYNELKQSLVETGVFTPCKEAHRLKFQNSLLVDLMPFGPIADNKSDIRWPPSHEIVMRILGFEESFRHYQTVRLRSKPVLDVKIVPLAGLALMKIFSWKDKYPERNVDATDLALIIQNYTDAGNFERILNEESDLLDSEDFDYVRAGARLLGRDIADILTSQAEKEVLGILNKETGEQDRYRLVEDMVKNAVGQSGDFGYMLYLLEELKSGFHEGR